MPLCRQWWQPVAPLRLGQVEVAKRMGVDRAHVSSMERGRQNITLLTLGFVAQALKVDPATLLAPTSKTPPRPTAARKVTPRRRRLS
ncbi:MAG: helix-turn-helix transcriptional regulator [Rhodospirillales bacterium]|nr:helix-turn-helix transcriptional regulator [Rhodospirillales bacterium]